MSEALLSKVGRREPGAMEECIRRHGGMVLGLARRFLRNHADAEEAVQDIFLDVWSNAHRYDPSRASERTMISMIARRRLIDRQRKAGRRPVVDPLEASGEVPAPAGRDEVEASDELAHVQEVLEDLKPGQRHALRLAVYEGLSHQQVSERMGVPLGTVKTWIRRGLIQVRARLMSLRAVGREGGVS